MEERGEDGGEGRGRMSGDRVEERGEGGGAGSGWRSG